jgi:pyruvate,water dikinase
MQKKEAHPDFVKWFSELSNKDVSIAGGKGASLSEMYNVGIPVPPGFIITAQSYAYFIQKKGIDKKMQQILSKLDVENTAALNKATREVRDVIEETSLPPELEAAIKEAYEILKGGNSKNARELLEKKEEDIFVAVRSSATAEDLADASFAGQQESFLNVKGEFDLLDKVKKCMSSLFTARATYYRTKKGFDHLETNLSVVVQKMVNSEKSGVMFSQNPTSDDKSIVIEAVWGLGEGIVSGQIKPDHYEINKDLENFQIEDIKVSNKKIAIVKNRRGKNETINLEAEKANRQVLETYEIKILAQLGRKLEEHYKKPQDIEFAIDEDGIFIVQSRPITTHFVKAESKISGTAFLSGLGASPGISSGVVKIVHEMKDLEKIQEGDVMVTEMTNPDMVVAMQKSAAIVTDEGGITSHAAIVSREMGIPAVVGTEEATKKLKDGDIITVDGSVGKVYMGKGETKLVEVLPIVPTKTKIKVIADLPEGAERAAKSGAKAVGLVRLEGIIAIGGKHPVYFVKNNKMEEYITLLSKGIKAIASHFEEIWVRTSDIRSDEYNHLEGAPKEVEPNPMMGDHGIRFSLKHEDIMKAELTAIKEALDDYPEKTIGIMIPQVISVREVHETKRLIKEIGMPKNFKFGIMVETPAAVQIIDKLCEEGINFVSFGTNDLTQFTLAIDRNNEEVQYIYDETHLAVVRSIIQVIRVCKRYGVETSICGQAGSREDMAKILVHEGIDSISVNADAAQRISKFIAQLEKEHSERLHGKKENEQGKQEKHLVVPQARQGLFQDADIEDLVLKELANHQEYAPGPGTHPFDIPALNEAITVGSEDLQEKKSDKDVKEIELLKESLIENKQVKEETKPESKEKIKGTKEKIDYGA